ncbi:iron ABC transporter permease [Aeromicrobium camelliae]|uniref:Iron ABC transporter permease n=1 Tax=Aeromicrobium camelliae TaxID=1538144 RepID=A0A3N6WR89_9ACTN|nr:iron ABC transporter permease [Aeromicrobium camelliae]RQN09996.1 iron ABC transporter permease [Aeromicrobium camelliae]
MHDPVGATAHATGSRLVLALAGLTAGLVIAIALSLMVGTETVAPSRILAGLSGECDREATALLLHYRLPRTAIAIVVGIALGTAGALMQAYTRNPLADPGILGVNAGAVLGVTIAIATGVSLSVTTLAVPALIGAAFATVAVLLLASTGRGPATPIRMTLAGVALGAVLSGIATAMRLYDPSTFERHRSWAAGSVAGRQLDELTGIALLVLTGAVLALLLLRPLNAVALGDDVAASLGVNTRRTRTLTIIAVTLLVGAATAIAGPISFLGLMVPHICRLLAGNDHTRIVPLSMLVAPLVLVLADTIARVIIPLRETPVGIVTAFVGAPVLIWLVSGRRTNTQ